ncbi:MAG TPA: hypothetical protein VFV81_05760 [Verrucomicrobiae bacterium]|nr:hypothetical protein [Verrucomicrobiae bacterium]
MTVDANSAARLLLIFRQGRQSKRVAIAPPFPVGLFQRNDFCGLARFHRFLLPLPDRTASSSRPLADAIPFERRNGDSCQHIVINTSHVTY